MNSTAFQAFTDAYVDPFDDYIEETGTDQKVETNDQEVEQTPVEADERSVERRGANCSKDKKS